MIDPKALFDKKICQVNLHADWTLEELQEHLAQELWVASSHNVTQAWAYADAYLLDLIRSRAAQLHVESIP